MTMQQLGITVTAVAYLVHESARYGCDASIFSRTERLFTIFQKYMETDETGWECGVGSRGLTLWQDVFMNENSPNLVNTAREVFLVYYVHLRHCNTYSCHEWLPYLCTAGATENSNAATNTLPYLSKISRVAVLLYFPRSMCVAPIIFNIY